MEQCWKEVQSLSEKVHSALSGFSTDFFFYPPITANLDFDILFEHTRSFGANAPSSVAFNLQLKLF